MIYFNFSNPFSAFRTLLLRKPKERNEREKRDVGQIGISERCSAAQMSILKRIAEWDNAAAFSYT